MMKEYRKLEFEIGENKTLEIYNQQNFDIGELMEFLVNAKKEGANVIHVSASSDYNGDVDEVYLSPYYTRLETDEEYHHRLTLEKIKEQERENEREKKDKALYEKLKLKFENQ